MNKLLYSCFFLFCFQLISAQDDIVVPELVITATKFQQEKEDVVKPVYEINAQTIEHSPATTTSELLNLIPNLHIGEANGHTGSVQNYSLRGGKPKDVLILINGIPTSDHSQISGFENLNFIPVESIEKIEVVAGGSSTLYGSNASAGVINIILKDAINQSAVLARLQLSKWGGFEQVLRLSGSTTDKKLSAGLALRNLNTKGFSAATDSLTTLNFDRDGATQQNNQLTLNYSPDDHLSFQLLGEINNNEYDFDAAAFTDSKDEQKNEKQFVQLRSDYNYNNGKLVLQTSATDYFRRTSNPELYAGNGVYTEFDSQHTTADLYNHYSLFNHSNLTTGVYFQSAQTNASDAFSGNFQKVISADSARFQLTDYYAAFSVNEIKRLNSFFGLRYHSQSNYDGQLVYDASLGYTIPVSEQISAGLHAGTNSAYITPSLFQLYSQFGNQQLTPEESVTNEAGLKLMVADLFHLKFNYFLRKEENRISFSNTTFTYANITGEAEAKGLEIQVELPHLKKWQVNAFYANTQRNIPENFYKLPEQEAGANISGTFANNFTAAMQYRFVGHRTMPLFNNTTFQTDLFHLNPYHSLNINLSKKVFNNKLQLFMAANNLLNEELVDNLGYNFEDFNMSFGATYQH